jgi:homoserine O-acetyltransferase
VLYPTYQQKQIRDVLQSTGGRAEYVEIDSDHGHDAFLIDLDQVGTAVTDFLDDIQKEPDDQ